MICPILKKSTLLHTEIRQDLLTHMILSMREFYQFYQSISYLVNRMDTHT